MNRRQFLAGAAALPLAAAPERRPRIAALSTTYHVRSHSDNFITRFLEGYWINDRYYPPPCDIVSLYMDQVHGKQLETIPVPEPAGNCNWGEGFRDLYITAGGSVYRARARVNGTRTY